MARWYGAQATIKVDDAIEDVTVDGTQSLGEDLSDSEEDVSGSVTEVDTSGGEMSVEVLNVMGDQLKNESRPDMKSVDLTIVVDDLASAAWMFGTGQSGTYTVYEGEDKTGNRENKAVYIQLSQGDEEREILLNNAYFTTREFSLSADGYLELTVTASCLVSDYYEAYK